MSAEVLYNLLNQLKSNHLECIFHESFYRTRRKNILGLQLFLIFAFFWCFHSLPFSGVFIFPFHLCFIIYLSWVFSFFTFLGCFHFSPFLGVSIFHLFLVFCVAVPRVLWIWINFCDSQMFSLLYTPSPHLPQNRQSYGFEKTFSTYRHFLRYTPSQYLAQPVWIGLLLGGIDSFSLKVVSSIVNEVIKTILFFYEKI